jgi:hypothetical protein
LLKKIQECQTKGIGSCKLAEAYVGGGISLTSTIAIGGDRAFANLSFMS